MHDLLTKFSKKIWGGALLDPPLSTSLPSLQTLDFSLPQHSFHDATCIDHPPLPYIFSGLYPYT